MIDVHFQMHEVPTIVPKYLLQTFQGSVCLLNKRIGVTHNLPNFITVCKAAENEDFMDERKHFDQYPVFNLTWFLFFACFVHYDLNEVVSSLVPFKPDYRRHRPTFSDTFLKTALNATTQRRRDSLHSWHFFVLTQRQHPWVTEVCVST